MSGIHLVVVRLWGRADRPCFETEGSILEKVSSRHDVCQLTARPPARTAARRLFGMSVLLPHRTDDSQFDSGLWRTGMAQRGRRTSRVAQLFQRSGSWLGCLLTGKRRRNSGSAIQRASAESLETRALLTAAPADFHVLFAPDTPQSVVDEAESGHSEFNADDRWERRLLMVPDWDSVTRPRSHGASLRTGQTSRALMAKPPLPAIWSRFSVGITD